MMATITISEIETCVGFARRKVPRFNLYVILLEKRCSSMSKKGIRQSSKTREKEETIKAPGSEQSSIRERLVGDLMLEWH